MRANSPKQRCLALRKITNFHEQVASEFNWGKIIVTYVRHFLANSFNFHLGNSVISRGGKRTY